MTASSTLEWTVTKIRICQQNTSKAVTEKVQDSYCPCGINTKQRSVHNVVVPQRAYKSRCKCINKHSKCSLKCKCLGNCGNTDCKKNAKTTEDKKATTMQQELKKKGQASNRYYTKQVPQVIAIKERWTEHVRIFYYCCNC